MRKTLKIAILFVILATLAITVVNAMEGTDLADKLYTIGSKYGMTSSDKIKVERYFNQYPATDKQAEDLIAKANEAAKIMDAEGITDISKISEKGKEQLKAIANEAAQIVDATVKLNGKSVEIYKDGKLFETITADDAKLAYTGNSTNIILVVSLVAIVALASVLIIRKKITNA